MDDPSATILPISLPITIHWLVALALILRVVTSRKRIESTFAWIFIIMLLPYVGAVAYLMIGELRLGSKRAARIAPTNRPYWDWIRALAEHFPIQWTADNVRAETLHNLAIRSGAMPGLCGNSLVMDSDSHRILEHFAREIDQAQEIVLLESYILAEAGCGEDVLAALERAVARGVDCRVLIDSVGSAPFLKSKRCALARERGVKIVEALPAGIVRALFRRQDMRLHRKLVVIDMQVGYTGSMNLVDPAFFKQDADVGQWVDVMVRVEGPAVRTLAAMFFADWEIETHEATKLDAFTQPPVQRGEAAVQLVPSGPGLEPDLIHRLLLTTIYNAREELMLVTPYFVPDEALHAALCTAAAKGVDVHLIIPEKCDSKMVHYASRSRFEELLRAGVKIHLFHGGLLHTKAIAVDRKYSLVGSVNFDMRSVWINYEVTLLVYDQDYTEHLRYLIGQYRASSREVALDAWLRRPRTSRALEDILRLTSPLL